MIELAIMRSQFGITCKINYKLSLKELGISTIFTNFAAVI